jgi:hypothetical protein
MKVIYVILIAAGTGIVGFIAGGGLGWLTGIVAGTAAGNFTGGVAGACMAVDIAAQLQMLTPQQAEKIGVEMAKQNVQYGQLPSNYPTAEGSSESCKRLIQGMTQAQK